MSKILFYKKQFYVAELKFTYNVHGQWKLSLFLKTPNFYDGGEEWT